MESEIERTGTTEIGGMIPNPIKRSLQVESEFLKSNYENFERVGAGAFGEVIKGKKMITEEVDAIKMIHITDAKREFDEVKILKKLNHPNILKLKTFFIEKDVLYVVTEYCEEGDLSAYLKKNEGLLSEEAMKDLILGIAYGIENLHQTNIIHRDIKPDNILITQDGTPKIADVGISKMVDDAYHTTQHTNAKTPIYSPPEVYYLQPYSAAVDIWSLGCVAYEIPEGKRAFCMIPDIITIKRPVLSPKNKRFQKLIEATLCEKSKRANIEKVLQILEGEEIGKGIIYKGRGGREERRGSKGKPNGLSRKTSKGCWKIKDGI